MERERLIIVDAREVLSLLAHYLNGELLPIDAELEQVGVSPFLQRWIGFRCKSDKWVDGTPTADGGLSPLHIRYKGKTIITLGNKGEEALIKEANDTPNRQ